MLAIQDLILYLCLFVSLFFEVFLLITYFEIREEIKFENKHKTDKLSHFPTVSIIVPCFNEEATVEATVHSLLKLNYPSNCLSLLLIDDGSTDNTLEVLNKFKDHPQITVWSKDNEGSKYSALNFGLTKVQSDLVGCLDADSFVDPEALNKILPFFEDKEVMAVTPSVRVHEPKNILQYMQRVEYISSIFVRHILSAINALYVTPGPFSIFRTRVFRELGGYRHAHHTEDMEMALRMQKNHYKIMNAPGAYVYTVAPNKLKALYKQRVRWTYGFINNVIDYKKMLFNRKHGNVGIFILPVATFSLFTILYTTFSFIFSLASQSINLITKYQSVGFKWVWPNINPSWFFISATSSAFVSLFIIIISFTLIFLALRTTNGRVRFSKEILYYLSIYMFIVPLWVVGASFNTIFARKVSWR